MVIRSLFVSLTVRLFVTNSNRCQMAPVTRNQKKLTSGSDVIKNNENKKLESKVQPKSRLVTVNKQNGNAKVKNEETGKELEKWLCENHTITTGIWVKIAKKSSGIPTVTYDEMLDVALCYGWIDGQRCGLDETWFLQRITPRRPKSNWSQINREKVKRLIRIGQMQPAGQKLIGEAKVDGRWDNASKPTSGCVIPDELTAALEASSPSVIKLFKTMSKPSRLASIKRIQESNSEKSKNEIIKSIISMLERGETDTSSM